MYRTATQSVLLMVPQIVFYYVFLFFVFVCVLRRSSLTYKEKGEQRRTRKGRRRLIIHLCYFTVKEDVWCLPGAASHSRCSTAKHEEKYCAFSRWNPRGQREKKKGRSFSSVDRCFSYDSTYSFFTPFTSPLANNIIQQTTCDCLDRGLVKK